MPTRPPININNNYYNNNNNNNNNNVRGMGRGMRGSFNMNANSNIGPRGGGGGGLTSPHNKYLSKSGPIALHPSPPISLRHSANSNHETNSSLSSLSSNNPTGLTAVKRSSGNTPLVYSPHQSPSSSHQTSSSSPHVVPSPPPPPPSSLQQMSRGKPSMRAMTPPRGRSSFNSPDRDNYNNTVNNTNNDTSSNSPPVLRAVVRGNSNQRASLTLTRGSPRGTPPRSY